MTRLEKPKIKVGYTPLCDCAPLVVTQELGLFSEHGLDVCLEQQSSWATSRDLLRIGALDAAHMLAPAPIASWMRADGAGLIAPMALNLNGNTIVLSAALYEEIAELDPASSDNCAAAARALARVAARRAKAGAAPPRFAAVFAESNHNIDLRRWLAAGGMAPDRDARIAIAPPGEVESILERGLIDGFCVGEPWGSLAVSRGAGRIVATSYDLWSNRIEKVLAVNSQFAAENPRTLDALMQALIRGGQWADLPENRAAVASLLVHGGYIDAPIDVVRRSLTGRLVHDASGGPIDNPDFLVFHRYAANFPWRSQEAWMARELERAGLAPRRESASPRAFRPSLYARAAEALGLAYPLVDSKIEGAHPKAWTFEQAFAPLAMGKETMFDGEVFDPLTAK